MDKVTKEEVSAGGVVYRKTGDSYEFLLGKHSGYHKWVLPKGLVEDGETQLEAAMREVEEEVGVVAKIADVTPLKTISYFYSADLDSSGETTRRIKKYQEEGGGTVTIHKSVTFYLMVMESDLGSAGWEMEERRWVDYSEGLALLAFETEREVFGIAGSALGCL